LANWIGHQLQNFNKNANNMKKENIKNDFQKFLIDHKKYIQKY